MKNRRTIGLNQLEDGHMQCLPYGTNSFLEVVSTYLAGLPLQSSTKNVH